MGRKARQNMRKGLSLFLSLVMVFSIMAPAGTAAEQVPYSDGLSDAVTVYDADPPSVPGEVYDSDLPSDAEEENNVDPPSVPEEVYSLETLFVTAEGDTWGNYAAASFAGGTGTTGDPYRIADGGQLAYLAQLVNSGAQDTVNGKAYAQEAYILAGNIDLSAHFWTALGQNTEGLKFTGSFDGGDKTVSGLKINETTDYVGLFGVVGASGSVKNLALSGATVGGKGYVGAFAGKIEASVVESVYLINHCAVTATGLYAGGLVGSGEGTFEINNCQVNGATITSSANSMGGILGYANGSGVISSCAVSGSQVKTSGSNAGGICGHMAGGTPSNKYYPGISRCAFTGGSVEGCHYSGGIVGRSNSCKEDTVSECYVDATISSTQTTTGGIIGWSYPGDWNIPEARTIVTVVNCYAKGTVTSLTSAGGIAGQQTGGVIKNCYTTAAVNGRNVGGISSNMYEASSCVALNPSLTIGDRTKGGSGGRIFPSVATTLEVGAKNFAFREMPVWEGGIKLLYVPPATRAENLKDGQDLTYAELAGAFPPFADPAALNWDSGIWNLAAGKLPTLKNLPPSVSQSNALPAYLSESIDWTIESFGGWTTGIEVHYGTAEENLGLPAELEATLADNRTAVIPVGWSSNYDAMPGAHLFTAVLPRDCVLAGGVALPTITVTVTNEAPAAKRPVPVQLITGPGTAGFDGGAIAGDEDGDPLTITGIVTPPSAAIATAALDSNGTVTLTRVAPGTTEVVVSVSDGATAVEVTVPVTVANEAPVAKSPVPIQVITGAGTASFDAGEIAGDGDGDPLTITGIVTAPDPAIATAALNSGTVTLTGVASGTTTMVVKVSDGVATVDVTVPVKVSVNSWGDYAAASFAGGTGTADAPYQIAEESQLAYLAQMVNSGAVDTVNDDAGKTYAQKAYALTGNIDLSGHLWTAIGQNTDGRKFTGPFDGNNKAVSGLHVNETTDYQGLFGVIGANGSVRNLTLSGATVCGKGYVGAVAGKIEATDEAVAVVENVHLINSAVTATGTNIGGLVGRGAGPFRINICTVTDSTITSSSTSSSTYIGGILGYADVTDGVISSCAVSGSQVETMGNYAGGICGYMKGTSGTTNGSEIFRCGFTGSVKARGSAGGIAGYCTSYKEKTVYECYTDGGISASSDNAGGIIGNISSNTSTSIVNCYAKGTVTATGNSAAGIANGGAIQNCYSTAIVRSANLPGGISSNGEEVQSCVALNPSIIATEGRSGYDVGRVFSKTFSTSVEASQNFAFGETRVFVGGKLIYPANRSGSFQDGQDLTYTELAGDATAFASGALNWDGSVWSLEAKKLPALKNLPAPVVQSGDLPGYLSEKIDWTIKSFAYLTNSLEVDNGTAEENIGLPAALEVILKADRQTAVIPVTWSGPGYDAATPGDYPFTAVLPEDCVLASGAALPVITVAVKDNYRVTFDARGGSEVGSLAAAGGATIEEPAPPVRQRFIFGGWYKDPELIRPWDFTTDTVTESITLYAKWSIDGAPDYTASSAGVQIDANIDLAKLAKTSLVRISAPDGFQTAAVVEVDNDGDTTGTLTFTVPKAGDYVYTSTGKLVAGSTAIGISMHPDEAISYAYRGSGTADDPWFILADLTHYHAEINLFGLAWIAACTWAGYYAPSGQIQPSTEYDESLTRNVIFETRDPNTGKLLATLNLDGTGKKRERIDMEQKAPFTLSFRVNPAAAQISGLLNANTFYADADRRAGMQARCEGVVNAANQTLLMFDEARELFGPATVQLDASLHGFKAGDEVSLIYLGGTGGGQYHGTTPPLAERLAEEMTWLRYYLNPVTVGEDGYLTFTIYNRGIFQLAKADDETVVRDKYLIFESNGGSTVAPVKAVDGVAAEPEAPAREGYDFDGWYGDKNLTALYDFTTPVTENIVLYAKWTETGSEEPGPGPGPGSSYTVTFVTGNDPDTGNPNATVNPQTVKSGSKAKDPGFVPSGYGYLVLAWYTDSKLENEYDFDTPVTSDLTLYPKWMLYHIGHVPEAQGGSGTENSPYRIQLANSKQSKIPWKALNELAGKSEWWKIYVTEDNERNGEVKYAWVFNAKEIERCDIAQPYYTDVDVTKKSSDTVQAKFLWRTAIEGKVYVHINVSDYFTEGTEVAISYVNGSCDGKVAHQDAESGEWVDSLHHPSTYYSGGTSKVEDGFVILELTHGGTYLIKSTGSSPSGSGNSGTTPAPEEEEVSVYLSPPGEAKDGAATVTVTDTEIDGAIKSAVEETADEIVIAPRITGEMKNIRVELSKTAVRHMADKTGAALTFKTDLATVTLAHETLGEIAGKNGDRVIFAVEEIAEDTVKLEIKLNVQVLENLKGVKLALPVAGAGDGMVAVLVKADGSTETIKKSVFEGDQLLALVGGSATVKISDKSRSFKDVDDSFWGKKAVAFAVSHELFTGVSEREFGPNGAMTRGMLVTVLHRLENTPARRNASFKDVDQNSWYARAVAWAAGNSLVSGTEKGFEPEGKITREQLAAMLYRYAQYIGLDTGLKGNIIQFNDAGQISAWAGDAMNWAVGAGLMTGKGDNLLDPKGRATRAEVAAMVYRLIQKMVR